MHWLLARRDERHACRMVSRLGGHCVFRHSVPFAAHITALWLRETKFDDTCLSRLGPLRKLKSAELGYSEITDRAVAGLGMYTSLEYLFLWGTQVTDASVRSLLDLPQLRLLQISATSISRDGFDALAEGLPNCLVAHAAFGTVFRGISAPDAYAAWIEAGEQ